MANCLQHSANFNKVYFYVATLAKVGLDCSHDLLLMALRHFG
jgi:hypothetical protein|tara:strand:+ start:379 stop:504 length:126 start_codon:yes stop_codon:yes gene_type:complete